MNLRKQFKQFASNKHFGHAYLLYNVDYLEIDEDLKYIISEHFFCSDNKSMLNDLKFISPSNSLINKEQVLELQKSFKTHSQINKNKIYIISECEKMNQAAANSLLKFLEEPEKNIYAFLISKDINKVLPTIQSRCIKLFLKNKESDILDEDLDLTINVLKVLINKKEENNINNIYELLKNLTRDKIKDVLDNMILILKDCLDVQRGLKDSFLNEDIEKGLLNKLSEKEIIRKILFLNDIKERLDYNINVQMFIDKLVIDW